MPTESENKRPKTAGWPVRVYLAVLAAAAAVPLALFMVIDVIGDQRRAEEEAMDAVSRIAESSRFILDHRLESNTAAMIAVTKTPLIRSNDPRRISQVLLNFREISRFLGEIILLDLEGHVTASADKAHLEPRESYRHFDWFEAALQGSAVVIGQPHQGKITGRWYTVMACAVRDESGEPLGVLSAILPLDEILMQVPPQILSRGTIITVVNDANIVVFRSGIDDSAVGQNAAIFGLGASGPGSSLLFSSTARLTGAPWVVHATIPKAAALARSVLDRNQTVALHGLVIVAVMACIIFLGRRFSEPLTALSAAARARIAGDQNARAPEQGPREIAEAATFFNEFATSLAENERELRASRERYKGLVDSVDGIVWEFDLRNRKLSFLSPQAERIVGHRVEKYFDNPRFWMRCLHKDDRRWVPTFCWSRLKKAKDYSFDCRVVSATGETIWFHNSVHHVVVDSRVTALQTVMVDITERKLGEQALIESESRYRMLLSAFPDIIFVVNKDGYYVDCLAADPTQLLIPREAIIGKNQRDVIPLDVCLVFEKTFNRVLESGRGETVAYDLEFPTGTRHFEARVLPHESETLLAIVRDVTAIVRAKKDLDSFDLKIRETQKLESLGVLAGGIAHDFNNLLTGILGNASLARSELPRDAPAVDMLGQIEKASLRAADLCRQMLAYSGRGHFVVKLTDIGDLASEMVTLLEATVSKKTQLSVFAEPDLPAVLADATQIRQVVMNLVINGSEALGEKPGHVSVGIQAVEATPAEFGSADFTGTSGPARYVCLEVRDTGTGMPEDVRKRIFEPFFSTKFTGRGLGLASVLGIARGHRGAISVESMPGEGTCFRIFLPAADGTIEHPATPPNATQELKGEGRVLIADDEEGVVRLTSKILTKAGFEPVCAENGREAVRLFLQEPESFVLALIDLTMPELDGVEALKLMREKAPNLRAVLMSGYNENDAVDRFTGLALSGFIQKPFSSDALVAKIRSAIDA